VIEAGDIAAHY